jgi:aldose 1-epimerase
MTDGPLASTHLSDPAFALEAEFAPHSGMICASLRHRGDQLLAQNAGLEAYSQRGKTMGIPLLYPWANRLAAFDYSAGGRAVSLPHDPARIALDDNGLPIHGVIGGRIAWELASPPGAGAGALSARLSWSEQRRELFELFPFRHELEYQASLSEGRLTITVTVSACGDDAVPVAFGFHPYLTLPGSPREAWLVELPAMRHLALDAEQIPLGPGEALAPQRFVLAEREFDDGFDAVAEAARFSVTGGERRITLEFLEGYPCAQVYAPRAGQFICFEPMTASTNALRSGVGLRLLSPGESHRSSFSVSVEDVRPVEVPLGGRAG